MDVTIRPATAQDAAAIAAIHNEGIEDRVATLEMRGRGVGRLLLAGSTPS